MTTKSVYCMNGRWILTGRLRPLQTHPPCIRQEYNAEGPMATPKMRRHSMHYILLNGSVNEAPR